MDRWVILCPYYIIKLLYNHSPNNVPIFYIWLLLLTLIFVANCVSSFCCCCSRQLLLQSCSCYAIYWYFYLVHSGHHVIQRYHILIHTPSHQLTSTPAAPATPATLYNAFFFLIYLICNKNHRKCIYIHDRILFLNINWFANMIKSEMTAFSYKIYIIILPTLRRNQRRGVLCIYMGNMKDSQWDSLLDI